MVYQPELKTFIKRWDEVKGWSLSHAPEGSGAARIEGLQPEMQYEFRVLGTDSQGLLSKPSDILIINTIAAPWFSMERLVGLAVVALVLLAGWNYYKRRQLLLQPRRDRLATA
jgi:hypothetical protein